ncbi:hypothetical protein [Streptomyces sp. NBC_01236]|uniref:hypothetical protein n=1 Tax=Streptomyces sp. NBC_01236 TaxID=2903789 RepID=UPI002E0D9FDE|nr:hypothetical protein OG324_49520 [Streptomyces sp. NBC_01236]
MIGFMVMARGPWDAVPLSALFPQLSASEVEVLRRAARAIDEARVGEPEPAWLWASHHAAFPGPGPGIAVILLADIVGPAGPGDQLEFLLDVSWTDQGELSVSAAVNVACWCDVDHATHDADALHVVIGGETSLSQAFQAGADRLVDWLADPRDPDYWRNRAGLPAR